MEFSPTLQFLISEDPAARAIRGRILLAMAAYRDAMTGGRMRRLCVEWIGNLLEEASTAAADRSAPFPLAGDAVA